MADFDKLLGTSYGDAEIDRIMEFAEAACIMPDPATESKSLSHARERAAQATLQRAAYYRKQVIRTDLVHVVVEKRLKLIAEASTVKEIKEIEAEPKPHYTGNEFITSKFSVPEEELIVWSITSTKAPLMPAAVERYASLFRQVFGAEPD